MKNILTTAVLLYLRFFAKLALSIHRPTIIGIAGSVGKSSARNTLYAILKDYFPTKMIYGNSETGIPLGILGIEPHGYNKKDWIKMLLTCPFGLFYLQGTTHLVVEMGIDDPYPPKNMEYLLTVIRPDIAISLNVSATHTMQFEKLFKGKNPENKTEFLLTKIAEEDTKIITKSKAKTGIYNGDDSYIYQALSQQELSCQLFTFGTNTQNSISYSGYDVSLQGTTFTFTIDNKTLSLFLEKVVLPKEYQQTIAAVILAATTIGLNHDQIKKALEKNFSLPKGRSSIFEGIHNSIIIDSSYNAAKASVTAFLDLVAILKKKTKRPVVFLFGDMRELGIEAQKEHEDIAFKMLGIVDCLYCVGPLTMMYVLPLVDNSKKRMKDIRWFRASSYAGQYLETNLLKNAIVLVKGSQNEIFLEEAIKYVIKDKKDIDKLCRQEDFWMNKKFIL